MSEKKDYILDDEQFNLLVERYRSKIRSNPDIADNEKEGHVENVNEIMKKVYDNILKKLNRQPTYKEYMVDFMFTTELLSKPDEYDEGLLLGDK
jgi:replicative superfamily II helicase